MKNQIKIIISVAITLLIVIVICIVNALWNNPKRITIEEFKEFIDSDESAIIYYGQESCGACQTIYPEIKNISREMNIKVHYLDAEKIFDEDILVEYGILYTPAIIVINEGEVLVYDDVNVDDIKRIFSSINYETIKERPASMSEITYNDLIIKMNSNIDFILYIGREDCRDCQKFHPIANDYIGKNSLNGIYYFDIKNYRDKTLIDIPSQKDVNFYDQLKKTFDIKWVPSIYHIRNGTIIDKFEYLSSEYYQLDENEKKEAEIKYNYEFYVWMTNCE